MPKNISADSRIEVTAGKPVELPNGDFVANAQMSREGMDLHLASPDGHTITIEGYFAQGTAPDLVTADGARLSPHLVNSFLPPEHAGQYAASGQIANDASPSGRIAEISGEAHIIRADGTHVLATVNAPIYQGDVIETSKTGAVNIQFADNTSFAISESARMSVDKFVYDSAHHSGSSFFSMLQGVFVYTSGLIGKADPGSVNIETPVGAIGIRGTVVAGHIMPAGQESKITILDGAISFTNGSGTHEMHESYNTVSLSGYQNQPTDMGHMDAQTFKEAFHSVAVVAGDTMSHFSGAAGSHEHGDNAPQNGENGNTGAAPKGAEEHGDKAAAPKGADAHGDAGAAAPGEHGSTPPDGTVPVPGAMPPAMDGEHGATMNGMPPGAPPAAAMMSGVPGVGMMGYGIMSGIMPAGMNGIMPGMPGVPNYYAATYNTAPTYTAPTYNYALPPPPAVTTAPPPPPPPGTNDPPPSFNIGFAFSPEYNDTIHAIGGAGIREFASVGTFVGTVMPFNASAGTITYNIAVNLASPLYHMTPTFTGHTDLITATLLTNAQQADITTLGITVGDTFSLNNGSTMASITIAAGESIQALIADVNSHAEFHAQMVANRLEIAATGGANLTVANVSGTPATALFSAANLGTHAAASDYSLSWISPTSTFWVDAAGHIFVNDPLALSHFLNPNGFNLTITATDGSGHNSVITQHLDIRDFQTGVNPTMVSAFTVGTAGADFLVGVGGSDVTLVGYGGADVIIGNTGNNSISISDNSFRFIDGGAGDDKLTLSTTGAVMDLNFTSGLGMVRNIETIDLGSAGSGPYYGNHVTLDLKSVFEMTDSRHTLTVLGGTSFSGTVNVITSGPNNAFHLDHITGGATAGVIGAMAYYIYQDPSMATPVTLVIDSSTQALTVNTI